MDQLLFFSEDDVDQAARAAIIRGIAELAATAGWIAGPPRFVEDLDSADAPIIGGVLEYPSAKGISLDEDRKCLAQVEAFVGAAQRISSQFALNIEFDLNGEVIGAIESGILTRSLRDGLLGAWRAALA